MGPRAGLDGCEKSRLHRDSIAVLISLTHKNVYQFTCTEQKATDNSQVHRSVQNFGSPVWNLLDATVLAPRI